MGRTVPFEIRELFGDRVFHVIGAPSDWIIDRVMHGNLEVPSIEVMPAADIDGVVIVLRRQ